MVKFTFRLSINNYNVIPIVPVEIEYYEPSAVCSLMLMCWKSVNNDDDVPVPAQAELRCTTSCTPLADGTQVG